MRLPACPICGRWVESADRPFCSRRCADVDLARWLDGAYRVPVVEETVGDGDGDGGEGGDRRPAGSCPRSQAAG